MQQSDWVWSDKVFGAGHVLCISLVVNDQSQIELPTTNENGRREHTKIGIACLTDEGFLTNHWYLIFTFFHFFNFIFDDDHFIFYESYFIRIFKSYRWIVFFLWASTLIHNRVTKLHSSKEILRQDSRNWQFYAHKIKTDFFRQMLTPLQPRRSAHKRTHAKKKKKTKIT